MTTIHFVAAGVIATSGSAVAAVNDVWKLTAFLAIGASLGVLWSCLSKEGKEDGRMTKARILAGAVCGICVPRVIEILCRWKGWDLHLDSADPLIIISVGFFASILGFYIAHSTLRRVESKEKKIGGMIANTGEKFIANALGKSVTPDSDEQPTRTDSASSEDRPH